MRVNKLRAVIYQLMFAGCLSASLATPALAGNQAIWKYNYSSFKQDYPGYRFRPLNRPPVRQYSRYRVSRNYYPVQRRYVSSPFMPRMNRARYAQQYPVSRLPYWQRSSAPAHRQVKAYRVPAFARQYSWEAAQPKRFRRGGSMNHYASESNSTVEQNNTPVYRAAPVSSHGFRFRKSTRNTHYVSFSDRVKTAKPVSYADMSQTAEQTHKTPSVVQPVELKPAANPYIAGRLLYKSGNYRFRPDERFQVKQQNQPTGLTAVTQNMPAAVPVSYQLANAELPETRDNRWDQWSFRPSGSTF